MPDAPVTGPADPAALESAVLTALARVIDPEIRKPITELDMVDSVSMGEDGAVTVAIRLTIVGCPAASAIERDVRAAAESAAGSAAVRVEVGVMTPAQRTALTERLRGGRREMPFGPDSLTRVYAVTSGKGGVGKSTVTANLAVALARRGLAVGLVDADVHGFSIPGLLGLMHDGRVAGPTRVGELMLPPVAHGVKVISIGMFLEGDTRGAAVSWRGPMLHRTISQFLTDVYFGDLDVLLLDLPPGTGDVAISIGQLLPHAEVLIVTTPQPAAADVAERSGALARQSGQRIVGVVENMSGLPQPDGSVLELFGSGGGAEVARRLSASGEDVPLLATLPISVALRAGGDDGLPVVIGDPEDPAAVAITELARTLASRPRGLTGRRLPMSVG
ncbi:ATP-binding protein involved in chromosome partitioning [Rathayibacter sp. PhB93]|uniref:Mrp/NBP35 family ATP-binding protein n=1 Tax=unclassified Rathayibacter TaxID=2609250 RepID=UPI000F46F022|nr:MULTISPECIES: Mrp/NBP35 family ATP-binding protein [unclassified Rathayibacter]ROQ06240.1 ATP-binding protein involved in chromosome partitioning [Rathayibacter sp. PhB93]TDQ13997.1 ATP-binding protein involved in chromosome partitioning [Rathayibacter sp. PhB1]